MPVRPINHARLFKRFSQITGVPLNDLRPAKGQSRFAPGTIGLYSPSLHTVSVKKSDPYILRHEERHAVQWLANRQSEREGNIRIQKYLAKKPVSFLAFLKYLKKESDFDRKWLEPTNADPEMNRLIESINNLGRVKGIGLGTSMLAISIPKIAPLLAYFATHYGIQLVRQTFVRNVIKRHGEDGLLLLWIAPPKEMDALFVRSWEKKMVQNGYLKPEGGLTRKGLRYWRERLQPQAIWKFLHEAEQKRKSSS